MADTMIRPRGVLESEVKRAVDAWLCAWQATWQADLPRRRELWELEEHVTYTYLGEALNALRRA